jgi:hypothetical protein
MRKIICSPERLIPQQLEEGTKYFSTYSNPRRGNVGYFGSTLVKDIQRVGLRPSETVWGSSLFQVGRANLSLPPMR